MTMAVAPVTDDKRSAALLKAIGLDRVPAEQRELALAIADRYGLDLMLKHIVLIEGRPYITRDGLLHIAHRSGTFDGMEVSDPTIVDVGAGKFWTARCSVYRTDMSRPFTYAGRYPTSGGNQKFAPEMATKVAEVMALRRAFDVSAPVLEERWDMDTSAAPEPEPPRTVAQQIADRKASVTMEAGNGREATSPSPAPTPEPPDVIEDGGDSYGLLLTPGRPPVPLRNGQPEDGRTIAEVITPVQCASMETGLGDPEQCRREAGHKGLHRTPDRSWPQ